MLNSKRTKHKNSNLSVRISIVSIIVGIISIRIHGSAPLKKQEILGMPTMYLKPAVIVLSILL